MDRSMAVHRRYNPLAERWILVSPHRAQRPWQGGTEDPEERLAVAHDPECYLCPGNIRASGAVNPDYRGPWVFANDFPAISPQGGAIGTDKAAQSGEKRAESRDQRRRNKDGSLKRRSTQGGTPQ